jgi:non-heme chloroperoxidase
VNLRIVAAVVQKDVRCLYLLVVLVALTFAADVFLTRLEWLSVWSAFRLPVLLLSGTLLTLAVFHADAAASLVDDWLCRPLPRAELLTAKLVLLLAALYLPRVIAMLLIDLILGASPAESLQEAFLFQESAVLLILPVILFTALVTRSIVQGFVVLMAILICVFAIPTPFVSRPGPLEPAIGDELLGVGLGWLAFVPATAIAAGLFALGCWLVYWRRRMRAARVLLGVTVAVALLLALLPMWLAPWKTVFAAQTVLAQPTSAPAPDSGAVYLRNQRACFPATRVGDLPTDPNFTAARQSLGVRAWTGEDLRDSGAESVAFLTSVEPRLPLDWRAKLLYVEANYYSAGGTLPGFSLRPATYLTANASSGFSHAWVLPDEVVRRLSAAMPVGLGLRYYFALLKPDPHDIPADGSSHAVPHLGYCRAKADTTGGHIDVDCFMGFHQPAQVSAELEKIPASRVFGPPDLSPRWTRWLSGPRVKLSIESPRLGNTARITITAWTAAGYVDRSLRLPGILGSDSPGCTLPTSGSRHFQQAVWRDSAPHEAVSVTVDSGVQLEVLDFGGHGSPIVLLPGLGATAHSYDELAPVLARKHRVLAITRRGTGYSSKPDFGFDTPRLAQDVLQVMDAMGTNRALLVGHSIAGEELTWLGVHHPERFSGLVYLDAAYDRSRDSAQSARLRELNHRLPPEPPLPPEALRSYAAMRRLLAERGHVPLPEGELIAFLNFDKPFLAGTPAIDARTQQAIAAAIRPPNYSALKIPALAIYAFDDPARAAPPWYDPHDAALAATLAEIAQLRDTARRENIERFRRDVEHGEVLEMHDATHYLIQSNQQQVLEAIETFASR